MRLYLVLPGAFVALAGAIFTLQGLGIVGPTSSFMFQSSNWIAYGLAIFLVGALIVVGGVWKSAPRAGP